MIQEAKKAPSAELLKKYEALVEHIRSYGSGAVAFSGGVDSAFLMHAAQEALGENAIAITMTAGAFPKREGTEAREFCEECGIRQIVCHMDMNAIEGFSANPKNRCYICKTALFSNMWKLAKEQGMNELMEGSNLDDEGDYRPGLVAIRELDVKSPLRICGFTKAEIRELSAYFGLPTWNKPSYACLASRFPYGEIITEEKLAMVEKGEDLLLELGFYQFRVRIHGNLARIEVLPEEFEKIMQPEVREELDRELRSYGFSYVTLDLKGYRTGSMNETLSAEERVIR